jgi:hypothetical protein
MATNAPRQVQHRGVFADRAGRGFRQRSFLLTSES